MQLSNRKRLLADLGVSAIIAGLFVFPLLFTTNPLPSTSAIMLLSTPVGFLTRLLSGFSLVGTITLFLFSGDDGTLPEAVIFIILLLEWTVIFFLCSCVIRLLLNPFQDSRSRAAFFYRHAASFLCLLLAILGLTQRPTDKAIAYDCLRGRSADTEKCIDLLLSEQMYSHDPHSEQTIHDLISYCMAFAPMKSIWISRPGGSMTEIHSLSPQEYCIHRLAEQLGLYTSGDMLSQLLIQKGNIFPPENEVQKEIWDISVLDRQKTAMKGTVSLCSIYATQSKSESVYDRCVAYFVDEPPSWSTVDATAFLCNAIRGEKPSKCSTRIQ